MVELLVSSNTVHTPHKLASGLHYLHMYLNFSLLSFLWAWNIEVSIAIDDKKSEKVVKNLPPPIRRWKSYPNTQQNSNKGSRPKKWSKDQADVLHIHEQPLPTLSEDEEAVGIITMEDVIEELLQVIALQCLDFIYAFSKLYYHLLPTVLF
jgi:hypothetical protein